MRAVQAEKAFPRAVGCFFCLRERCGCRGDVFPPARAPDRCGQRPLPPGPRTLPRKNAPASLRGRFSVRESVSTAALSAFCPPTRRMSLRKNAPRAAWALFTSEIARFAARPGECCHENAPRAAGTPFLPLRAPRPPQATPLPSGPANVAMKNAPAQREGVFLFTAAPDPAPRGLLWPL